MNNRSQYWTDLADYDFETAKAMLQTQRWLYVGFMCHQVIEKMLTTTQTEQSPYSHSLTKLARGSELLDQLTPEQSVLISTFEPLNIEACYPAYKGHILRSLTSQVCEELTTQTQSLKQWIQTKQ